MLLVLVVICSGDSVYWASRDDTNNLQLYCNANYCEGRGERHWVGEEENKERTRDQAYYKTGQQQSRADTCRLTTKTMSFLIVSLDIDLVKQKWWFLLTWHFIALHVNKRYLITKGVSEQKLGFGRLYPGLILEQSYRSSPYQEIFHSTNASDENHSGWS